MVVPDNTTANHLAAEISEALGENESALRYYKVVQLFEPDRQGIKEKISELENKNKKEEIIEAKKEEQPSEERFEIPAEEQKEGVSLEVEEAKEEVLKDEIDENIQEDDKSGDKIEADEQSVKYESEEKTDEINGEKTEESFLGAEEKEIPSPLQSGLENQNVLEGEDKISEEIGEDTLTDLLEESSDQEKIEENFNEDSELQESELKPSTDIKEEEVLEEKAEDKEEVSSLSTATLADLYEKQGYPEKAIEIYQHILLKEPEREDIRKKIEKLKKEMLGMETQDDVGVVDVKSALRGKRIEALKEWLRRIREAENV
ncbi:MAG: hypothetical protein GYA35_06920 [Thermoanaerobaculaceae bacterium]|nr:hypothetical protein [Thermoanaerobaculaceae bacterium]